MLLLVLNLLLLPVLANVEIVNFHHHLSRASTPDQRLPNLSRLSNSLHLNISSSHPLVVAVDTHGWSSNSFTLRASYSAAYPFDIDIQLDKDNGLARITATSYGLPIPGKRLPDLVPIVLTLECLYWGVLPATILPTIIFLLVACSIAAYWIAPFIHAHALKHLPQPQEKFQRQKRD